MEDIEGYDTDDSNVNSENCEPGSPAISTGFYSGNDGHNRGSVLDEETKVDYYGLLPGPQVEMTDSHNHQRIEVLDSKATTVEWIEEITFPYTTPISECYTVHGRVCRRWRGAEWSLVVKIKPYENTMGLFLGIDSADQLPETFQCSLRFRLALLNTELESVAYSPWSAFNFAHKPTCQRVDWGHQSAFEWSTASAHAISDGSLVTLRFRVIAVASFCPARVPLLYDSHAHTHMVGIENLGATCYLNSLLQMLFHITAFRQAVYDLPIHVSDSDGQQSDSHPRMNTTLALQSTFVNLQSSTSEVGTMELMKAFGWTSAEALMQQDVQEMMRVLIDKLEDYIDCVNKQRCPRGAAPDEPNVHPNFLKAMFCGKIKSYIRCVDIAYQSDRVEDFYDVQLDVRDCADIYESFHRYTSVEMLDGENQYYCEEHRGKFDAKKGVVFAELPPILTIHLKRFDFDMISMNFKKIHDYYEFPSILYLDEYVESSDPVEEFDATAVTPNTYVLHSVLVHNGDVGGGHYYAFIRPATAYNTQKIYNLAYVRDKLEQALQQDGTGAEVTAATDDEADEESSWFKFNDEVVMKVSELEAIHNNYGRKSGKRGRLVPEQSVAAPPSSSHRQFFAACDGVITHHIQEHNNIDYTSPSFASAYMLVYIRLSEAQQLMQPTVSIPRELSDRLNLIRKYNDFDAKMADLESEMMEVRYCMENQLVMSEPPSRTAILVPSRDLLTLSMHRGSQRLGALLQICQLHKLLPIHVTLWSLAQSKSGAYVLCDSASADEYDEPLGAGERDGVDSHFFVQLLHNSLPEGPPVKVKRGGYDCNTLLDQKPLASSAAMLNAALSCVDVEFCGYRKPLHNLYHFESNYHLYNHMKLGELAEFVGQYKRLLAEEQQWKARVGELMAEHFTDEYAEFLSIARECGHALGMLIFGDMVHGCGIGMKNAQLSRLNAVAPVEARELEGQLARMKRSMLSLLLEFSVNPDNSEDQVLCMFKVFDPHNLFQHPLHPQARTTAAHSLAAGLTEPADESLACSPPPGLVEDVATLGDGVQLFMAADGAEYNPLKYFGYAMINGEATMARVGGTLTKLLALNHVWVDNRVQLSDLKWDLHVLHSISKCKLADGAMLAEHVEGASVLLVAALRRDQGSVPRLPCLTPALAASLCVRVNTRAHIYQQRSDPLSNGVYSLADLVRFNQEVSTRPSEDGGTSLRIYDRQYKAVAAAGLLSSDSEDGEDAPPVFLPAQYLKYCQFKRVATVLPLQHRDVSTLLAVHKYFNVQSLTSELVGDDEEAGRGRKRPRTQAPGLCFGLRTALHLHMPMRSIVALVANKLVVHPDHLMLFLSDGGDLFYHLSNCQAATFYSCETLSEYLGYHKYSRSAQLFVFYAITDYSLAAQALQVAPHAFYVQNLPPLRELSYARLPRTRRSVPVLVNDCRLRFWRRLFLDHLRGLIDRSNADRAQTFKRSPRDAIELDVDPKRSRGCLEEPTADPTVHPTAGPSAAPAPSCPLSEQAMALIEWSDDLAYLNNPYLHRSERDCCLETAHDISFGDLCVMLRTHLALPINLPALLASSNEVSALYHRQCGSAERNGKAVPAEAVLGCHLAQSADAVSETELSCNATSQPVRLRGGQLVPSYALMVCAIREGVIDEVGYCRTPLSQVDVDFWTDAGGRHLGEVSQLSVQSLDLADVPYMLDRGLHADLFNAAHSGGPAFEDSMVVSCFYFTLFGNSVEVCAPHAFNGPFLAHVRSSDSYADVVERLARITGDEDLGKCRLAVVSRKKEVSWVKSEDVVWEAFIKQYRPGTHVQVGVEMDCRRRVVGDEHRRFAWLGIQRSVADVQAASQGTFHALRYKAQASTGIKIT